MNCFKKITKRTHVLTVLKRRVYKLLKIDINIGKNKEKIVSIVTVTKRYKQINAYKTLRITRWNKLIRVFVSNQVLD